MAAPKIDSFVSQQKPNSLEGARASNVSASSSFSAPFTKFDVEATPEGETYTVGFVGSQLAGFLSAMTDYTGGY